MVMVSARGFTLTELTIAIAIVAILTAGTITAINIPLQLQKARDGTRKSDVRVIQSALEIYRTDQRCYPQVGSCGPMPSCASSLTVAGSTYLRKIPCNPTGGSYTYTPNTPTNGYTLQVCLENRNDSDQFTKTVPLGTCASTKQYELTSP